MTQVTDTAKCVGFAAVGGRYCTAWIRPASPGVRAHHCVVSTSSEAIPYSSAIPATSDNSVPTSLVPPRAVQDLARGWVVAVPGQLPHAIHLRSWGQQLSKGEYVHRSDHRSTGCRNVAAGPRTSRFGLPDGLLAREGHDRWLQKHATFSIRIAGSPAHRLRAERSAMLLRSRLSLQCPQMASRAGQLTLASGLHCACAHPPFSEHILRLARLTLLVPRARAGLHSALPAILASRHRLSSVGSN